MSLSASLRGGPRQAYGPRKRGLAHSDVALCQRGGGVRSALERAIYQGLSRRLRGLLVEHVRTASVRRPRVLAHAARQAVGLAEAAFGRGS